MRLRPHLEPSEALAFLTSRIDYERTLSIPYSQRDFRLDRMRQLLARLGNPQQGLKIVHVAGTKGKGSTAAMLASMLQAAGHRVGLYSSPHLDRVEERVRIDGLICPPAELAELVARLQGVVTAMDAEPAADEGGSNRPTYFEIITALALLRFAEHQVDAAVLEVGLGGRLDSTNVCQPLVSVITSISFDHTQQLGRTLAAIAGEKAGIIKPRTPTISGVMNDEARQVIVDVAARQQAPLLQRGIDFDFDYSPPRRLETSDAAGRMNFRWRSGNERTPLLGIELRLPGRHQAANAAVALAVAFHLRSLGWSLPDAALYSGLASVDWPARVEVVSRRPAVVLDAAHNVASVEALLDTLAESFSARRRVLVFGTTRDKDVRGMLQALLPHFDDVIFTRYASNPRGVPPEDLANLAQELAAGLPRLARCRISPTPDAAWQLAPTLVQREDLICVTGSFFIAAEIRAAMRAGKQDPCMRP
jgi:dihydrofolate synthase/folylpolyglutamate synthase